MKKLIGKPWIYNSIPVLVWFLLLVLPFISGPANLPHNIRQHFIINVVINNFLLLCIFYLHTYFIYPLLKSKSIAAYVISLVILLGLFWLYSYFWGAVQPPHHNEAVTGPGMFKDQHKPPFNRGDRKPYMVIFGPLIALLCSYCYRIILDDAARQQLNKERETIHLKTELNFLRSQISPHFMFNVLNNLVALARKKSDDLEPAIVNLSQIMRYMLYESDDNRVNLSKEIEYVKSYIDLQMLRYGSEVTIKFNVNGDPELFMIEPMLLIPFVENAFKHGTGMIEKPLIIISLNIMEEERLLKFVVLNPVTDAGGSKDDSSGIGLTNVKRRLDILYPHKHKLHIHPQQNSFKTELVLQLA
ncbi:sensor histidine kinase [Mucilaginibacter terrae]|uniref:Two-component system LytT family sensor kinase n=1 Tax=Mucilaginibacter terrae TaxID=1955052 RepID=A0ABU3GPA3_9SPHI|nr:histidine kinase [Mucilaginibacter terrae]MDT3401608.1 two-component system LytT family sensor kinase [Mucilaginibacter terrae]